MKNVDLLFKMDDLNKNNFGNIFSEVDIHSNSFVIVIRKKNHVVAFVTLPKNISIPCVVMISVTQEKTIVSKENLSNDTVPFKYDFLTLQLGGQ